MKTALENLLLAFPEVLNVAQIAEVLGGTESETVDFLDAGLLIGAMTDGHWRVCKPDLLGFILMRSNRKINQY